MAFFGRQFSASPVLTLSPQPSHQTQFAMGGFAHQHAPPHSFGATPFQTPPPTALPRFAASAGRKRSRDEASINLEPEAPPPVQESEDEWTYGEGMVLIKSGASYVADASTQSGTWLEEKITTSEEDRHRREAAQLSQRCHKSQRTDRSLDRGLAAPSLDNSAPPLSSSIANPPEATIGGPVIDDFTLHLGIGWRRISEDEHIQAAARGWARFIENHYPLSNVNIRLESKGLQSYLVEASEGFFLFAESLRQGQLLSSTVDGALRNLQSTPPQFDGGDVLLAAESPRLTPEVQRDVVPTDTDMKMD
jgi:hypothetical protein